MLRLKEYLETSRGQIRQLVDPLFSRRGWALFRDTLFLSFLGARICYASTRPFALFAEKRFQEDAELLAFLGRLQKAGHTSIFAHSPLVIQAEEVLSSLRKEFIYKAWWTPRGEVCLNLRHLAEVYDEETFQRILKASLKESSSWLNFRCFRFDLSEPSPRLEREAPLGDFLQEQEKTETWAQPLVTIIEVAPDLLSPFGWLAVVVEGLSRLFSHQFVRHTWLNFNQRSHRYTEVDQFVCPPSFDEEARRLYKEEIERSFSLYQRLLQKGIKKEDARFVTPQGSATTIMATGPLMVWEDFVAKRKHPKAQWEIRRLALALEVVLAKV